MQKEKTTVISRECMELILQELKSTDYGLVVLVAQDKRLVQIEKNEKIRVVGELPQISKRTGAAASAWQAGSWPEIIQNEFAKLKYGKLSIVVQGNRITQLERVEKQRFTGIDGEGI